MRPVLNMLVNTGTWNTKQKQSAWKQARRKFKGKTQKSYYNDSNMKQVTRR